MNVLSVFDGISCGQMALEKAGLTVNNYYASEINVPDMVAVSKMYPNTQMLGDICDIDEELLDRMGTIDLFIGGSPCQSFSRSGDGSGFDGKSKLFWEYVRLLKSIRDRNPEVKFLLENVLMKKEWEQVITDALGVEPIMIDSTLVSAQKRQRLYWTNIEGIKQPEDKGITIIDIVSNEGDFIDVGDLMWFDEGEYRVKNATKKGYLPVEDWDTINLDFPNSKTRRGRVAKQKCNTLNTSCNYGIFVRGSVKKLTTRECARLQTIPEDKIDIMEECMTDSQIRFACGNGWTVDVIAHIFSYLSPK